MANSGSALVANMILLLRLKPEYGSGFSKRQLLFSVRFYKAYTKVNALRSQLNLTQYYIPCLLHVKNKPNRIKTVSFPKKRFLSQSKDSRI